MMEMERRFEGVLVAEFQDSHASIILPSLP